jgi:KDO2-lipid IV(A) lauroyltransferase
MQSSSRLLDLVYAVVFGALFPLFLFAARNFSRRSRGFDIADNIMRGFMRLRPKYLDAVRANMAQVLGLKPTHSRVDALARRVIHRHAQAWMDFFFYGQRDPEEAIKLFTEIRGEDNLRHAITEGKGVIMLTAHAGNFELGGLLLRTRNLQAYAVYKPDRFEAVERLRTRIRSQGGVVGIPVDGVGFSTLPLLKLLREGKIICMQGDRDFSLNGLPIAFFGREVHFPRGPWELAAMTGAPIICTFFFVDEEDSFHVVFGEPIHVSTDRTTRKESIEDGMRRYAAYLEDLIRNYPDQWYCFYPFWDDPMRRA